METRPFPNPFARGVRFSLATGLHVIAADGRRHLWQAWGVRQAAERAVGGIELPNVRSNWAVRARSGA